MSRSLVAVRPQELFKDIERRQRMSIDFFYEDDFPDADAIEARFETDQTGAEAGSRYKPRCPRAHISGILEQLMPVGVGMPIKEIMSKTEAADINKNSVYYWLTTRDEIEKVGRGVYMRKGVV